MSEPQRIVIIGKPGSGKSTFALYLAKKLHLPLLHLDKIFFIANWEYRNYYEFLNEQQSWVNQEHWIIDGNSIQSLEMRYERATMVVYFNYPKWLCCLRIFKRFFYHDSEINDMPDGCTKNISWKLITYLWEYENRIKPELKWLKTCYPDVPFHEITSDKEQKMFEKKIFSEHVTQNTYIP